MSATGGSAGSASGDGGLVSLANFGTGSLTLDPASVSVAPLGTNGNAGIIDFALFNGSLNLPKGGALNASGVGDGNGGRITLAAQTINVKKGPVTLAANGAGFGSGGFVGVRTTISSAAGGDLELGSGNRALNISVSGGSLGGQEGIVNILCGG